MIRPTRNMIFKKKEPECRADDGECCHQEERLDTALEHVVDTR